MRLPTLTATVMSEMISWPWAALFLLGALSRNQSGNGMALRRCPGDAGEKLQRQLVRVRRLSGNLDNLLDSPLAVRAVPCPDGRRKVLQRDNHTHKSVGFCGVMGRTNLEDQLVLLAQAENL